MRFSPPNRAVARALTNVLGLTTLPEIVRSLTSRSKRLHSRSSVIGLIALHQLLAALRQYRPDFSLRRACTYRCLLPPTPSSASKNSHQKKSMLLLLAGD